MDLACPKELATEILSDSDHSTKVAPTTLRKAASNDLENQFQFSANLSTD